MLNSIVNFLYSGLNIEQFNFILYFSFIIGTAIIILLFIFFILKFIVKSYKLRFILFSLFVPVLFISLFLGLKNNISLIPYFNKLFNQNLTEKDVLKYQNEKILFDKNLFLFYKIKQFYKTNYKSKNKDNNLDKFFKVKKIVFSKNTLNNNIKGELKNLSLINPDVDKPKLINLFTTFTTTLPLNIKIINMKLIKLNKNTILIKNFNGNISNKVIDTNINIKGDFIINKNLNTIYVINLNIYKKFLNQNEISILYNLYKSYYSKFGAIVNNDVLLIKDKEELNYNLFNQYLLSILKTNKFENIKINLKNIKIDLN